MSDDGPWLSVPQAVVLVATRDIELALGLTENNAALLVIKANQRSKREGDARSAPPTSGPYLTEESERSF